MTFSGWVGLVIGVITIVASFAGSVNWLVKHYLSELKPDGNGGHNLEGRITRLEQSQQRVEARIDQILLQLISPKSN